MDQDKPTNTQKQLQELHDGNFDLLNKQLQDHYTGKQREAFKEFVLRHIFTSLPITSLPLHVDDMGAMHNQAFEIADSFMISYAGRLWPDRDTKRDSGVKQALVGYLVAVLQMEAGMDPVLKALLTEQIDVDDDAEQGKQSQAQKAREGGDGTLANQMSAMSIAATGLEGAKASSGGEHEKDGEPKDDNPKKRAPKFLRCGYTVETADGDDIACGAEITNPRDLWNHIRAVHSDEKD